MLPADGFQHVVDSPKQAQRALEKEYFVSPDRARLAVDCAQASVEVQRSLKPGQVSLYIGIPSPL